MDTNRLPSAEEILTFIDTEIEGDDNHYDLRIKQLSDAADDLYSLDRYILDVPIRSRNGIAGKVIILIKRVFRKFTRWYYKPAFDYQNDINDKEKVLIRSMANVMAQMSKDMKKLCDQLEELKSEQESLVSDKINKRIEQVLQNFDKSQTEQKSEYKRKLKETYEELTKQISLLESEYKKDLKESYEELTSQVGLLDTSLTEQYENLKVQYEETAQAANACIDTVQKANLDCLLQNMEMINSQFNHVQDECESKLSSFERRCTLYDSRVRRVERKINGLMGSDIIPQKTQKSSDEISDSKVNDLDYFLFESKYRGSLEEIKERQRVYLDIFKGRHGVVDCGCGRGEFVELLCENGIDAIGIDCSEDNVQFCQERQLPVYRDGILEYFSRAEDNSVGGIFCSQVVEHFTTEQLLEFVSTAFDKLEVNAPIVIETINPKNVVAVSNWFYMDLTHVRPVHPETLRFVLETYGFAVKEVKYLNPDVNSMLPKLNSAEDDFNSKIDKVNEYLFGPQDYAVVAYKVKP